MILPLLKVNVLMGLFINTVYSSDFEDIREDKKYRINSCPCGLSEMEFKKEYRYGIPGVRSCRSSTFRRCTPILISE